VFLGTGGAFAKGRRSNLGLLIEDGDFTMLVEVGPVVMQQLARVNVQAADVGFLFVSHSHGDHTLGFPMLALNRIDAEGRLRIYTGATTAWRLKTLWRLVYPGLDPRRLNLQWCELPETSVVETKLTGGITLRTAPVHHPPGVPTLGARWEFAGGPTIAFATDTVPNPATIELARGCDLLIHEASFSAVLQPGYDPSAHSHSTARQAGELAREAGAKRLALVHLGPSICGHPNVLADEARGASDLDVLVPSDGERISL